MGLKERNIKGSVSRQSINPGGGDGPCRAFLYTIVYPISPGEMDSVSIVIIITSEPNAKHQELQPSDPYQVITDNDVRIYGF